MPEKTLNVGIIGFGMIGKVHAYGYAAMPYYCRGLSFAPKITHVATAHAETAEKAREQIGCPFAVTDFREITENPNIDIVHICTPNAEHADALVSAIQNHKHIYCDKPLTSTLEEADRVAEALAAEGERFDRTTQMTFHLRFFAAIRRAKALIDSGRLGRIFEYRVGYYHSSAASADGLFKWKNAYGGGAILDLGAHLFDLIDYLVGTPSELIAESRIGHATRLCSSDGTRRQTVVVEDAVTILTRGRTSVGDLDYHGRIEATKLAAGREDELELEISGQKGAIRFSLLDPHWLWFFDAADPDRPYGGDSGWKRIAAGGRYEPPETDFPSQKSSVGWLRGHVGALAHFLTAIDRAEPGEPDLRQGIKIQTLLDFATRSAQKRAWIPVFLPQTGEKDRL